MTPSGWDVLDLSRDPTPGQPGGVRVLARSAERTALDADRLVRDLHGVTGADRLLDGSARPGPSTS